jgi:HEAT repeat protein
MRSATPQAADTIEGLIEQLKNRDYKVSKAAAERLIELNDPASIPLLVEVLKGDYVCNCQAASILLEIRGAKAIPDVLEAMANPPWWDDQDGMAAVVGDYFMSAGKTASEGLVLALHNPDAKIRQVAAWGLDYVYDADTIPALMTVLNKDADAQVQKSAAVSVAHFRDVANFYEIVMQALNPEAQGLVREEIAYAEQLERSIKDQQRQSRRESIIRTTIVVLLFITWFAIAVIEKLRQGIP